MRTATPTASVPSGFLLLAATLKTICLYDGRQDYELREQAVMEAMAVARGLGFRCGYRIDPEEPDWPVAFIQLPTGQVSWHMPQFPDPWDGHDNEEKRRRIVLFLEQH